MTNGFGSDGDGADASDLRRELEAKEMLVGSLRESLNQMAEVR